ncbi:MAG: T9SS type A sorting domain-containing protein [Burkholderiales bacterium]|nr:T9SS type A sorting domain-containing protein [Bacteroidia bacterium]
MKKIYLMGLTTAFALSFNAQTTIKLKNPYSKNERSQSSTSKVAQVGCTITSNTQYVAGSTMDLAFTYLTSNTDLEYVDYLAITFPTGITPTGLANTSNPFPNTEDAGGGLEALNAIAGQVISWGANTNDTYGGIFSSLGISFTVNVTIASGITGSLTASFDASGDGYGATPGDQIGSTFIIYPAGTAVVDMKTKFVIPTTITAINNCSMGMSTIFARFINSSSLAQSNFPVNYSVNGAASTTTVIAGPLAIGDSVDVVFATPFNFTPSNMYNVKAWVSQPSDVAKNNDTASLVISNTFPTALTNTITPYINGIESAYDFGSINKAWAGTGAPFGQSFGTFHTGAAALFYTIPSNAPAATYETFAILPCVDVASGDVYKISYWRKANTSATLTVNGQSAIFTGTGQDIASMTTVVKAYSAITPNAQTGVWQKDSAFYTSTANETRYFAIGGKGAITSTTTQINVRIDDIKISKEASVGVKTIAANDAISIFPNPTSGILNINAIEVNSTVEVFNVIGDKVYTANLTKGNNTVDLSGLANGAYFVKLNSNGQVTAKKVVLSK